MILLKKRFFWLIVLSLLTAGTLVLAMRIHPAMRENKGKDVYGEIPEFQLTERSGKTVSREDLLGKVWIADFIFTRCAAICPVMSVKMLGLQQAFKEETGLRFVSFTVDPERDTPQVLSEYANRFSADPEKWLFLTGEKEKIFKLSQQHFHLGASDIEPGDREAPDQSVNHSSKFALVDRAGKIRGYYESSDLAEMIRLKSDLKKLLEKK